MKVNLSQFSKMYGALYTDTVTVYRSKKMLKPNKVTYTGIDYDNPVYEEQECYGNFPYYDYPHPMHDYNLKDLTPVIITYPEIDLRKGDVVVLKKRAFDGTVLREYKGQLAEPKYFQTHQEAKFMGTEPA